MGRESPHASRRSVRNTRSTNDGSSGPRHERWLVAGWRAACCAPTRDWMKGVLLGRPALQERGKARHRPANLRKPDGDLESRALSSDRFGRGPAARLAGFFLELALGARPVLERISGSAAALQINLVSAQRDLLGCRISPDRSRLSHCWRGTLACLAHSLLPSTAASILHLGESHRFRIHCKPNRKIQYNKSTRRAPPE